MRDDYKVLGDYIQVVDIRNKDLTITNLLGKKKKKRFIPISTKDVLRKVYENGFRNLLSKFIYLEQVVYFRLLM